jgi:hypothetical protein
MTGRTARMSKSGRGWTAWMGETRRVSTGWRTARHDRRPRRRGTGRMRWRAVRWPSAMFLFVMFLGER